jgi:hypothetical protein
MSEQSAEWLNDHTDSSRWVSVLEGPLDVHFDAAAYPYCEKCTFMWWAISLRTFFFLFTVVYDLLGDQYRVVTLLVVTLLGVMHRATHLCQGVWSHITYLPLMNVNTMGCEVLLTKSAAYRPIPLPCVAHELGIFFPLLMHHEWPLEEPLRCDLLWHYDGSWSLWCWSN